MPLEESGFLTVFTYCAVIQKGDRRSNYPTFFLNYRYKTVLEVGLKNTKIPRLKCQGGVFLQMNNYWIIICFL